MIKVLSDFYIELTLIIQTNITGVDKLLQKFTLIIDVYILNKRIQVSIFAHRTKQERIISDKQ